MSSAATDVALSPTLKAIAPRRCFICLTDQDSSEPDSAWVNPCPCTLEAHHDCMLSWVTDCERTNKPLACPVCKYSIAMEGPWDPVVAFDGAVRSRFSKASPYMLCTALFVGVNFGFQMYGAVSLSMFAGKETMIRYLLGHDSTRERIKSLVILTNIAPALLVMELFPTLSNKIFVPIASAFGVYHFARDDQFFMWPPSPQLAMTAFPYFQSIYHNFYREFVLPHETKLNRQLMGLPPAEQQANRQNRQDRRGGGGGENQPGGIIGLLQGLLDALDQDDEDEEGFNVADHIQIVQEDEDAQDDAVHHEDQVIVEVVIEEVEDEDNDENQQNQEPALIPEGGIPFGQEIADVVEDLPVQPVGDDPAPGEAHEAPRAPAQRQGLGTILSSFTSSIAGALLLPGISYVVGEALRLALPTGWTQFVPRPMGGLRASLMLRPSLLQQQWGRSLVGGCLYVVIRDIVRVYAKHRKVALSGNRRVRNVVRKGRR